MADDTGDGRQVLEEDVTEADLHNYVHAANNAISPFDYEIRSTFSQHDRTRVFALVNVTSDPITQVATTHSADEIAFLKRVLDGMFESNNTRREEVMAIKSMQALALHKAPGGSNAGENQQNTTVATQGKASSITMTQAEKMLDGLVDEGWFEKSRAGYLSLSPRALIELRNWLLETYNEPPDEHDPQSIERVRLCEACKEIVTIVSLASIICPRSTLTLCLVCRASDVLT